MNSRMQTGQPAPRRDTVLDGEHPDVVIADILGRPRPDARVIVVANEKGGVGKSTIAFHLCVALADAGLKVAAIDLDRRQQTLSRVLQSRDGTARRLGTALPMPRQISLQVPSGAMLFQEISRIGWDAQVVVIDAAGHDSPIARRAIAMADTLVTPVNSSFIDLDVLGHFHPVTLEITGPGCFARTVGELRDARARAGLHALEWLVVPNRIRKDSSQNRHKFEDALGRLAPEAGFRVLKGLAERVAYRELFLLGLTHLDLRHLPDAVRGNSEANREILALAANLAGLDLPGGEGA